MALRSGTHGIICIHGIGDNEKRGDFLASVTNSLADALLHSPARDKSGQCVYPVIERDTEITADPPSVTLHITAPDGAKATWVCKEAFWGDAFSPPAASSVLRWLLKQIGDQLKYVAQGLLKDPANNKDFKPADGKEPEWSAGRFLSTVYRLEVLAIGIFLLPLTLLVPILSFILWPLYWMPSFGFLADFLQWVHKLDPFLSHSLGDVKRYIEHGVWSASARDKLESIIIDMLEDETTKDITIVAHSMGCVVTYDALIEGGKVARKAGQLQAKRKSKKLTFISVGSGINQVFRMARKSNLYARRRFKQPLAKEITGYDPEGNQDPASLRDKFFWLDIYARFDPVPAGDLDPAIEKQAKIDSSQVKRRRVVNLDNPVRDHTYYWRNKELVMPRIARAINGGVDYPWPEAGITEKKLKRHYGGVAMLVGLRILMTLIVVASLVASGFNLIGNLSFLPMPVPLLIALVAVGLYQAIRSWKFGDIS